MRSKGRPGKGSSKVANVKLRPVPLPEERAAPRRSRSLLNAAPIPRTEATWDSEDEDEQDEDDREEEERPPLAGMRLTTTGTLEGVTREQIRKWAASLGATFESVLAADATFLVADRTEGDKYRAAVDHGIPVLHSSFLQDVHARWISASPSLDVNRLSEEHRLAPLHGLTICLSGYPSAREELRTRISSLGGAAYSPSLDSKITHLVLGPEYADWGAACQTVKVQAARRINAKRRSAASAAAGAAAEIQIVWGEWLEHSLAAFGRQDETKYACERIPARAGLAGLRIRRTQDILTRARESPRKANKNKKRPAHEVEVEILRHGTGHDLSAPEPAGAKRRRIEGEERAASAQGPSTSGSTKLKKHRSATQHAELLGVQDLLAAPASASASGQSTLPPMPRPLPGSSMQSASFDLKGKMRALDQDVDMDAEAEAEQQQRRAGPSLLSSFAKARSSRFSSTPTAGTGAGSQLRAVSTSMTKSTSADTSASFMDVSAAPTDIDEDPEDEEEEGPPPRIYEGKSFGLRLPPDAAESVVDRFREEIELRGGSIREDDDVDFLIYKFAQTEPLPEAVQRDPRALTDVWLQTCNCLDALVLLSSAECTLLQRAMFSPLHGRFPLPASLRKLTSTGKEKEVHISYSGFPEPDRDHLVKFCEALGLSHEGGLRRGVTTHLIIPSPEYESKRLDVAQRWGVTVVFPDWLRGLAKKGLEAPKVEEEAPVPAMDLDDPDSLLQAGQGADRGAPEELGPLAGCRVAIHRDLETPALKDQLLSLGSSYASYVSDPTATHFIFRSRKLKDPNREFRAALSAGKAVVHPAWVQACAASGAREPEQAYRWTMDASRSLQLGVEGSQSMSRTSSAATEAVDDDEEEGMRLPPPLPRAQMQMHAKIAPPPVMTAGKSASRKVFAQSATAVEATAPTSALRAPLPRSPPPPSKTDIARSASESHISPQPRKAPLAFTVSQPAFDQSERWTTAPSAQIESVPLPLPLPLLRGKHAAEGKGNDSGFVPSSTEKQQQRLHLLSSPGTFGSGDVTMASSSSSPRTAAAAETSFALQQLSQSTVRQHARAGSGSEGNALEAESHVSATALNRDIIAEMHALMQEQQQQPSGPVPGGGAVQRFQRRPFISGAAKRDAPAKVHVARAGPIRYEGLFESQFPQSQTQQPQRQEMVIRISDPSAEAAKARLLADIGRATAAGEEPEVDSDETQKSSEETQSQTQSLGVRQLRRSTRQTAP